MLPDVSNNPEPDAGVSSVVTTNGEHAGLEDAGTRDIRVRVNTSTRRRPVPLDVVLFTAAVVLCGFVKPRIGGDFAFTDIVVAAMIVSAVISAKLSRWRSNEVLRRLALPLSLISLGTVVGSIYAGVTGWIVANVVRDIGVYAAIITGVHVLRNGGARARRLAFQAVGWCLVIVTLQLVFVSHGKLRSSGTFANPNIPAHLLATGLIVWSGAPFSTRTKRAVFILVIAGIVKAGSFGSLLQLGVAFGYLAFVNRREWSIAMNRVVRDRRLLVIVGGLLAAAALIGAFAVLSAGNATSSGGTANTGLNQTRLNRSADLRLAVWDEAIRRLPDMPFGVGPGSIRGLNLNSLETELHNEYLAYLAERGVIGLTGLLLFWCALWRMGKRGSVLRALIAALVIASLFRETMHYRHVAFFIAIAIAAGTVVPDGAGRFPS